VSGEKKRIAWSKEDCISWVRQRIRNWAAYEADKGQVSPDREGIPDKLSLQVWLAKEADGRSWQQIVLKYFPQYRGKSVQTAGISRARRCHEAVERALSPTPQERLHSMIDGRIRQWFECTPEQFKQYLNSIPKRRRPK